MQHPTGHSHSAFTWLTQAFLLLVWGWVAFLGSPLPFPALAIFSLLFLLHALLHAYVPRLQSRRQVLLYLGAQTALAAALTLLAGENWVVPAIFFPVAGEAIALLQNWRERLLGVGALLLAWAGTLLQKGGWGVMLVQLPGALLALLFVATYVLLFIRQAREKQRAEGLLADLEVAHRQLEAYAARVEELTVTQERQRMARELHDTLAQGLAGLIMQLEAVDDLLGRGDLDRARAVTDRARSRARSSLAEARAVIAALRSPLQQTGLVQAIHGLIEGLRADSGIPCVLEIRPGNLELDSELAEQLYRVVQEGLINIARHSRAQHASVRLEVGDRQIELTITDDGVGFHPDAVAGRAGHFGLTGLQERLRLAGGQLRLESRPGGGTRLQAAVPLYPAEEG